LCLIYLYSLKRILKIDLSDLSLIRVLLLSGKKDEWTILK
jgi:hypothetical protein